MSRGTKTKKSAVGNLEELVARKVVTESLRLKKGESVTVETWNNGLPLARRVVVEARKVGALPIMIFEDEDTYVEGVKNVAEGSGGQMGTARVPAPGSHGCIFLHPQRAPRRLHQEAHP